ncbi:MAG: helix-turn-helix domain-containing protein [Olsenella sp.]|jgi:transcriptional regulator with XRE-family HTH domain|nr:helix-turn-helix domain-containing protein [Olsenella sp.]MCI1645863.1 helix-turn-helix domain-containing protein [Olsenella sp.]MCI1810759.1 helix-turn-helix domain-containing protein [Olsenella sp.]
MDAEKVGATISVLRKRKDMTQRELADQLRVTDKAVSRWERGLGVPDQSLLSKLAEVLETDIEVILEGELWRGEPSWRGLLWLNYEDGIGPDTMLYGKRSVYLQLGYLLLAGIRRITVAGMPETGEAAKRLVSKVDGYDVDFSFVNLPTGFLEWSPSNNDVPASTARGSGTMLVTGLDFLYGKDLTRAFKRQMAECEGPVRLTGHNGVATSVYFVPGEQKPLSLLRSLRCIEAQSRKLERGIVCFPIESQDDVIDAANLIAILERHSGESVMDLGAIARHRGM